jgi:hypothetical protein
MGWLFPYHTATRRQLLADLTGPHTGEQGDGTRIRRVTLRHCCVGNVLWAVQNWEIMETGETTGPPFIVCYLMQRHGTWGYKALEESCGPAYYHCPESYLALAPEPDGRYAREWRERVRAHHVQRRAARLQGAAR